MKKLMIICSTSFYDRIPEVIDGLKNRFELIMTNGYGEEDNNDWRIIPFTYAEVGKVSE